MGPLAQGYRLGGRAPVYSQQIDTERCGECRQGRVGTRKGGGHDTDTEQQQDPEAEIGRSPIRGRSSSGLGGGQGDTRLSGIGHQQDSQHKKEQIDRDKGRAIDIHILTAPPATCVSRDSSA